MATYVCSDIHGAYNKFKALLKKIKFNDNDQLYILGDVIDRGMEPIPLLLDIMERKNVTLLLGNHECMMYDAYYGDSYDKCIWYSNGGTVTDNQLSKLSEIEQELIFDYIFHLPIVVPDLIINNKHYYLAHASYIDKPNITGDESLSSLNRNFINMAIWGRDYPYVNIKKSIVYNEHRNKTLIAGHTMTFNLMKKNNPTIPGHIFYGHKKHYINIDCGCSLYAIQSKKHLKETGRLGCLCLDTMKEFYV